MERLTAENYLEGQILLIDKPLKWSSFQAVNKLKYASNKVGLPKKFKIGHAGTLDPHYWLFLICTENSLKESQNFKVKPKNIRERFIYYHSIV
jgi:tRNA pseudouridine55 synthase